MMEIRVRWVRGAQTSDDEEPTDGGIWFPDTPFKRETLMVIVDAGNAQMGEDSHWLEERQA